jgi:predicted ArsR family transcriptional regulator
MAAPSSEELTRPTRARLLARVAELGRPASTEELSAELGLHVNGVRRHLERLHGAGLLERRRTRHGRGRPRDEWTLAPGVDVDETSPRRYADLARWLARVMPAGPARLRQIERSGREIGGELASLEPSHRARGFRDTLARLGFAPALELRPDGELRCRLDNCPYVDSVRENAELVCTLHRGITAGILDRLAPDATLTRWEPHDPEDAGCIAEATGTGWSEAELEAVTHAR